MGTVGVVVLDREGNLAAGTSTGGMNMKRWGRVGDSPIIGAGTWADNRTCAISCTGHGEYFIRYGVAQDIAARMEYKKISLQKAADEVVHQVLKQAGGEGGVIGIDQRGNIVLSFNTPGMYRGHYMEGETPQTAIFGP
jgi:beta-aspartyl-peptidase (threonine type)